MSPENNSQDNFFNQPSISKEEAIILLEKTINQLNNVINKINKDSETNLPNKNILNNLVKNSNELLTNLSSQPPQNINQTTETSVNHDEWDEILEDNTSIKANSFSKTQQKIIPKKTFLATIKSLITKPIIWICLISVAIAFIFIFNFWGTNSSQDLALNQPLESTENIEKIPLDIPEELPEKQENYPEKKAEQNLENELEQPEQIEETPLELLPSEEQSSAEISLPAEAELTPEQSLIASIQNQVAEITRKYADGLILGIKANFNNGYLTVTIGDNWYAISENEQNKLTKEILEKAQILDFYKLTIIDKKGNLIARNPIVGNEAIIVRR